MNDIGAGKIILNNELATYLDGFNLISRGNNMPSGDDFEFYMSVNYDPEYGVSIGSATETCYVKTQDYNVIPMWSQLRKIYIMSNSIPISPEVVPVNTNIQDSGQVITLPILTDFILSFDQAGESRSLAVYNPTSQYRLIDLISDAPLNTIDLSVYWCDRSGNYYPLMISVYQQGSIKIGFFKKELYNNNNINNQLLKLM